MSGSSLDGLDIAAVSFDNSDHRKWSLISSSTYNIPNNLLQLFKQAGDLDMVSLTKLESDFTQFIAQCVVSFMDIFQGDIDFIAVHGQTLVHLPDDNSSWQLVNGGMLSSLCNSIVVTDFRNQDMALGGQGAPMAVLADRDLFEGYDYYLNLGGIANISYRSEGKWVAYDLIPFNQIFNYFANKYGFEFDKDGRIAREGKVEQFIMNYCLSHDYLKVDPPKSLDNTEVKADWILVMEEMDYEPRDILRSYIEFATTIIANTIGKGKSLFITGGGAHNRYFIKNLEGKLQANGCTLIIPELSHVDYKESILMAYAGMLRLKQIPNFVSEATGANMDSIAGAVYLPPSKPTF